MLTITTIGLDIAKSVFQVHGIDAEGMTGDFEAMALYAGQGIGRIDSIVPAGERRGADRR